MLALEIFSDNQLDNNNEMSEGNDNCRWQDVLSSKRKRPLSLRICKSESNVRRRLKIDKMGSVESNVSRSRSLDNIKTDSIVYEALTLDKVPKRDESSLCDFESEDDYNLLQNSEDEIVVEEPARLILSLHHSALDDRNIAETLNSDFDTDSEQLTPPASCQDNLTLPRVSDEVFVRSSAPYKSLASDNVKSESPKPCRSMTLPKTRSRQIDSRTRSSISTDPEHIAAIVPASLALTSETGKNDLSILLCSNLI
jgi:hypothetical protein